MTELFSKYDLFATEHTIGTVVQGEIELRIAEIEKTRKIFKVNANPQNKGGTLYVYSTPSSQLFKFDTTMKEKDIYAGLNEGQRKLLLYLQNTFFQGMEQMRTQRASEGLLNMVMDIPKALGRTPSRYRVEGEIKFELDEQTSNLVERELQRVL